MSALEKRGRPTRPAIGSFTPELLAPKVRPRMLSSKPSTGPAATPSRPASENWKPLPLGAVKEVDLDLLARFSVFAGYLVPIGRLQRWALAVADLRLPFGVRPGGIVDELPPATFDLVYIGLYILVALLLAMVTFQRRDV